MTVPRGKGPVWHAHRPGADVSYESHGAHGFSQTQAATFSAVLTKGLIGDSLAKR